MDASSPDCEVYYAVNDSPEILFMARRSALGVRRFNSIIPISLVVYGQPDAALCDECRTHGIDLIVRPPAAPHQWMYLKLLALAHVSQTRRLLYVDADTEVFGDVQA